jgi:NadR type nicotinamide-nucleotide adenylyltransferase
MKKIVVVGPESTGKSTLCSQLAEHYNTTWCPEYAREYLYEHGKAYEYDDLLTIAKGQLEAEDAYVSSAKNDLYFIDTNMYVMKVWCEYVYEKCHQFILDKIVDRKYDLYLLCDIDLPWTFDDLREYPDLHSRQELARIYQDILVNQSTPWAEISGAYDERLSRAIAAVNSLI